MSNVIIKGMEMPKSCLECALYGGMIIPDGICVCDAPVGGARGQNINQALDEDTLPNWCPLHPAPEWVSVDYNNPETLPHTEKAILYCAFGRSVGEGCYRGFDGEHYVWKMYAVAGTHWDYEVTHWMPLPEVPE